MFTTIFRNRFSHYQIITELLRTPTFRFTTRLGRLSQKLNSISMSQIRLLSRHRHVNLPVNSRHTFNRQETTSAPKSQHMSLNMTRISLNHLRNHFQLRTVNLNNIRFLTTSHLFFRRLLVTVKSQFNLLRVNLNTFRHHFVSQQVSLVRLLTDLSIYPFLRRALRSSTVSL